MKIILDTDIGSDTDDALALALILGSPEIELIGITTVYGDTRLRAQLASRYLRLAGHINEVPIAAGSETTLSGKEIWWPGHEGKLFDHLEREPVRTDGVRTLRSLSSTNRHDVDILAIGPLTNIAIALNEDSTFESNVNRLVIMGGDFGAEKIAEHNLNSDVVAARRVFESNIQIVIGGFELTQKVRLTSSDVAAIALAGPLGTMLAKEIGIWWKFIGETGNTPHDPILALWLVEPELFTTRRVRVEIDDEGKTEEYDDADGTVIILDTPDPEAIKRAIVRRIVAGSAATSG
jgi:purine nucleosidase